MVLALSGKPQGFDTRCIQEAGVGQRRGRRHRNGVTASTAGDGCRSAQIGGRTEVERVTAGAADQHVGAAAAGDRIGAVADRNRIGPGPTSDREIARIASGCEIASVERHRGCAVARQGQGSALPSARSP